MGGAVGSRPRRRKGSVVSGRGGGLDLGAMKSLVSGCRDGRDVM